ncbi:MAG: glucokinase [Deltaproteobacteria bacterium]|nr:glucokinase [Deltaproteobacteria bacterium]
MSKSDKIKTFLAADIGGTKTEIGFFQSGKLGVEELCSKKYKNSDFSSPMELLDDFMSTSEVDHEIQRAVFGIAAPVFSNKVKLVNIDWSISKSKIARFLGTKKVEFYNDLLTTAAGIGCLNEKDILTLQSGKPDKKGNIAVMGVGTGLGEAMLVRSGKKYVPCATEGGHADFAPATAAQTGLLLYLKQKFGHVSYERIASGRGIKTVYDFISEHNPPESISKRFKSEDPSAVIVELAGKGEPGCVEAVRIVVDVIAAEAGNMALRSLASNGVYIGGGAAYYLRDFLMDERFLSIFVDKGRYREFLSNVPVKLILDARASLLGAASLAIHGGFKVTSE